MANVSVSPKILPITPENYPAEIPTFSSEAEERDFWDTHDSNFYFADGEDVTNNPPADLRQSLQRRPAPVTSRWTGEDFGERVVVRFSSSEMDEVRTQAGTLGIDVEELVKRWIVDALASDHAAERKSA